MLMVTFSGNGKGLFRIDNGKRVQSVTTPTS